VQPRFSITLNNTDPTWYGWADYNGVQSKITSTPNSGPTIGTSVLSGRLIVVRRGTSASGPGTEAWRGQLKQNSTFTIEP
jgi:hypothetical protein